MSRSERLTPVDAMFLDLEEPCAHMHVGGVLRFEGRPPPHDELVAHVASRLDRVPRYRQRLAPVPLHLGRPVWVDDASLDLAYHLPSLALPPPGGEVGLKALAARFLGEPLDRSRPLWRLALVDGLGADRFALLSKTQHCVLDGIGGMDFLAAITDA
ncbi:MAG: wax ester/triacylglycerol synthase domain-containing protein, partial [Syntrophomonadaceae bacterium]